MPPTRTRPARAASKAAKPYDDIVSPDPNEVTEEKPGVD